MVDSYLKQRIDGTPASPTKWSRRRLVKFFGAAIGTSSAFGLLAACSDADGTSDSDGEQNEENEGDEESVSRSDDVDGDESAIEETSAQDSGPTGTLVMALEIEPPYLANHVGHSVHVHPVLRNIMEALTNKDPETNELVPELAVSWEVLDDLTWRFELREGVQFHDGSEFNAEAAASMLNRTWDPENGFEIAFLMGPTVTCSASGEFSLDVESSQPNPILPNVLFFSPIPSMRQLEDDPDAENSTPIGTGPYQFVEWARGEYIRATVNPDWWGHDAEEANGKTTFENIEWVWREESAVRAAQLQAGEVNVTQRLTAETCEDAPACLPIESVETHQLRLDTMHVAMSDIRIRQAIALSIDHQAVADQIYTGSTPASQSYNEGTVGFNSELQPYPYDMDRAKALVEEAEEDGVPIDEPLIITTTSRDTPGHLEMMQYLGEQLAQIGLNAEIQILDESQARQGAYETPRDQVPADRGWILLHTHSNEVGDAALSMDGYYTCDVSSNSTFCDQDLDAQLSEATALPAGDEREEALSELSALYYEQYAIIPLVHVTLYFGATDDVDWTPRLDGFMLAKEMSNA